MFALIRLLFIDTECTVTDYYLNLQFENTKVNILNESNLASAIGNMNKYHLVLFLEPDVEWVQDGTRTYGDEKIRISNNNKLKHMLRIQGVSYHTINGDYQNRFSDSVFLIENMLNQC